MKMAAAVISLVLVCTACTGSGTIEHKIARLADQCQKGKECTINLSTAIPGDWDTLYYFRGNASDEQISAAIGQPFHGRVEFATKFLLRKDGGIKGVEEDDVDIEQPTKGEVMFLMPDDHVYAVIDRRNPIVKVEIERRGDGAPYYLLSQ